MIGAIIGSAALGVAALVGIAGHHAILKDDDDDEDRDALFKTALNKCSQRK
jgi:cytochrome c556